MFNFLRSVSVFLRERLPVERRASERTCDTYALALRLFFEFAARRLNVRPSALTLEQLEAQMVLDFLAHLEAERHNSPATRNVRLAAVRTFMRFVEYREPAALAQVQRIRAIPMKRVDTRLVDYLNRDAPQIERLSRWDSVQEFSRVPDALDPSQMLAANAARLGHQWAAPYSEADALRRRDACMPPFLPPRRRQV